MFATSQLRNFATSQLRNFATSQLRNFATSQLRNFATSQLRNFAIAITALLAVSFSSPLFAISSTNTNSTTNTANLAALPSSPEHNWSIFGGIGWSDASANLNNNTFIVSNIETDRLTQTSGGSSVGYTAGFARNYDLSTRTNNKLQSISIGMTLRYDPSTLNGQMYQFQDSTLNNYSYQYQIRPITQLAESDLVFSEIQKLHLAPFIAAGVGITEANLHYQETPQTTVTNPVNTSTWVARPDLAIGAGLLWDIKQKKYFLKTQYLFQYRGNGSVALPFNNQNLLVNLNEQSVDVLFGYRFK